MQKLMADSNTTAIPGPWVAETSVSRDETGNGLSIIAVDPEIDRDAIRTPTRGMIAWVHSGLGACKTEAQAVATARFIAAAPDMAAALSALVKTFHARPDIMQLCGFQEHAEIMAACDALNKAGVKNVG
jgi:hypothetical protein